MHEICSVIESDVFAVCIEIAIDNCVHTFPVWMNSPTSSHFHIHMFMFMCLFVLVFRS